MIENIIDFDPKEKLQDHKISYNELIKSSSSDYNSNNGSLASIKTESDACDDKNSLSSNDKNSQIFCHTENNFIKEDIKIESAQDSIVTPCK